MSHLHQRTLFSITWPIFVEQAARIAPGIINALMLARLGDAVVAGVTIANQVVMFCTILFAFIGIGCSVVITHFLGAGDRDGATRIAAAALGVNSWVGLTMSVVVGVCAAPLLRALDLPSTMLPSAVPYLTLLGATLFLEAVNVAQASILRAHGHTRDAMMVTMAANLVNVGLNFLLVLGLFGFPRLGAVGAGISTICGRLIVCVVLGWLLRHRTSFQARLPMLWRVDRASVNRILHIGLPAAGENLSWSASFMVITYFVGHMGDVPLAAFAYLRQITTFLILLPVSIGLGTEIMIGHLVGAGQDERAYDQLLRSLRLSFCVALAVGGTVASLAPQLLGLFTRTPAVVASAVVLVRLAVVLEPGRTFNLVVINALRATGDARFPVLMGMCSMWGVAVPLAWLLGLKLGYGLPGVWLALITDEWLRGICMYLRWRSRIWQRHAHASRLRVAAA
jgi:putative MATE family efflux protein